MSHFESLPPRHQLAEAISRLYRQGLTTTSGGNLSILDDENNLWITPAAVDKGNLTPDDMVCIRPDHTVEGHWKPSSEFPFHRMIYERRPDVRAVVHAHPPALVSFSIVRRIPDTTINPQSREICGEVGYAPYALPGSEALGEQIAGTFAKGYNAVLLENHGVVTAGENLLQAFQRLETLEYCAQINILASRLGPYQTLSNDQIAQFYGYEHHLKPVQLNTHSTTERELRLQICQFVHRAYERHLMISTGGTVSTRVQENQFLITPYGFDRKYVTPEDLVLVWGDHYEAGKQPSRAARLHQAIYEAHPDIHCIMSAQPPNATTYAISSRRFDSKLIPESYIVLRDMPVTDYGIQYNHPEKIAALLSKDVPIILMRNDAVLATGATILQAFDRMEVAEFSAQALINTASIGSLVPIGDSDINQIKEKFLS
jgi:L-fuculose-phosphate aldolase